MSCRKAMCEKPKDLKGKVGECSPKQVKKHPCLPNKSARKGGGKRSSA